MSSKDRSGGGIGLVMGAGFGFLVGIMIDNLGLGIALGAAFGLLFGSVFTHSNKS